MKQTTENSPKPRWLIPLAVTMLLIGFGISLAVRQADISGQGSEPVQLESGTLIPTPRPMSPFRLSDHTGNPFSQESIKGRWHLLSFGYTHCPDVCPTTLAMLARLADQLGQESPGLKITTAFVTVDPERDTPEVLASYVTYFDRTFLGISGDPRELARLTGQLGILYARVESDSNLGYLMDHSNAIILTDPQGQFHALFSAPHDPKAMARDLTEIITP